MTENYYRVTATNHHAQYIWAHNAADACQAARTYAWLENNGKKLTAVAARSSVYGEWTRDLTKVTNGKVA